MGKKGKKLKIFSALEVANLCGVVNQTAINWIKNGYLKAFTTPGGQYRVYAENLIEFIENRGMILPEELVPYKAVKNSGCRILVIDSDPLFGNLLKEKVSLEKKEYEIRISLNNMETGYQCAKLSPETIILKTSFRDTDPEKLKSFFEKEKISVPFIITITDTTDVEHSSHSDITMKHPVDFNVLFDHIDSNSGKKRNGAKK